MTTIRGVRRVTITTSMFTIRMVVLCRISQIEEIHGRDSENSYKASSSGLEIRVNRLQCTGLRVLVDATLAPARRYTPDSPVHGSRGGCRVLLALHVVPGMRTSHSSSFIISMANG